MRFWPRRFCLKLLVPLFFLFIILSPFQSYRTHAQWGSTTACPPEGCKVYFPAIIKYLDQISNGNFESGPVAWKEYSAQNYFIILSAPGELQIPPHSGSWAAWLGGENEETASIDQNIVVSATRPYLHYWQWVVSDELDCSRDEVAVLIDAIILTQGNLCQATNTDAWEQRTLDLSPFAGQVVNLKFLVTTDTTAGTISSLYLDDISLEVSP